MNIDLSDSKSPCGFNAADPDLLDELRTRARIRLNSLLRADEDVMTYVRWIAVRRRWKLPDEWKLHHALNIVATELGFQDWEHARRALGGQLHHGEDMGGFWYDYRCQLTLNHWFARYEEAQEFIDRDDSYWLFPFRKQFVAGQVGYVQALGLSPDSELIGVGKRNIHALYGTPVWRSLCAQRLAATRGSPRLQRHF